MWLSFSDDLSHLSLLSSLVPKLKFGFSFILEIALYSVGSQRKQNAVWEYPGSKGEDVDLELSFTIFYMYDLAMHFTSWSLSFHI
jgi:hypothetical protein